LIFQELAGLTECIASYKNCQVCSRLIMGNQHLLYKLFTLQYRHCPEL